MVFLALPHGASQDLVPELRKRVGIIVDLAADFRLKDAGLYPTWYGEEHHCPELLAEAAFGIPELFRDELPGATLVAAAGCYVDRRGPGPGPPGAGRRDRDRRASWSTPPAGCRARAGRPRPNTHFNTVDEDFTAYGLLNHRHTPEIEQAIGAQVLFTPHLAPMNRGILATCYARPDRWRADPDPLAVAGRASTPTSRSWWCPSGRRRPRPPSAPTAPT